MEKIRNVFNWYNRTDHDLLSASILGAAGLFAAWVMVM